MAKPSCARGRAARLRIAAPSTRPDPDSRSTSVSDPSPERSGRRERSSKLPSASYATAPYPRSRNGRDQTIRNATQHKRRHRRPLWLQCDMFLYGRINLAKALTAGDETASACPRAALVNASFMPVQSDDLQHRLARQIRDHQQQRDRDHETDQPRFHGDDRAGRTAVAGKRDRFEDRHGDQHPEVWGDAEGPALRENHHKAGKDQPAQGHEHDKYSVDGHVAHGSSRPRDVTKFPVRNIASPSTQPSISARSGI